MMFWRLDDIVRIRDGRKIFLSFLVSILSIFYCRAFSYPLFFNDGSLTYGARELCRVLQIEKEINSAVEFNKFFQENFLRPSGLERWETFSSKIVITPDRYDSVFAVCDALGMMHTIYPKRKTYDYVVIFGSATPLMKKACSFVKNTLQEMLNNDKKIRVYFLTGDRPLTAKIDSERIIKQLETSGQDATETNAAKLIFDTTFSGNNLRCIFIDVKASELRKKEGELKRANTFDTIERLLSQEKLTPGNILVISGNPFISYQDNVFRNALQSCGWFCSGGTLETVGYSLDMPYFSKLAQQERIISMLLDNIARCAFEEIKQVQSIGSGKWD